MAVLFCHDLGHPFIRFDSLFEGRDVRLLNAVLPQVLD